MPGHVDPAVAVARPIARARTRTQWLLERTDIQMDLRLNHDDDGPLLFGRDLQQRQHCIA